MPNTLPGYDATHFFDELIDRSGEARPAADGVIEYFAKMSERMHADRQEAVESTIEDMGISE